MNSEDRMHKLDNGSDTALWAAKRIRELEAKLRAEDSKAIHRAAIQQEKIAVLVDFIRSQETLDPEYQKILYDNLWDLYEK